MKGAVSKRKLKILKCKIGNEFRKSHLFEPLGKFLTFPQ